MADREPDIKWSGSGGLYVAVVEGRMAAVVYWAEDDQCWRWVPADRPWEHFQVTHGEPSKDAVGVVFTAKAVLEAYLSGVDPIEASDKKSYLQEQSD
jgi:hypothetical protein